MIKMIKNLFKRNRKETVKRDFEWERFQEVAKEQFKKLRDKGISLPIVTL